MSICGDMSICGGDEPQAPKRVLKVWMRVPEEIFVVRQPQQVSSAKSKCETRHLGAAVDRLTYML